MCALFNILSLRLGDVTKELNELKKKQEKDLKALDSAYREQGKMGDAEKQKIVMQISAVQTELRNSLDSR